MMNKKFSCIIICLFEVAFAFAQNTRKFELLTEVPSPAETIYTPTGNPPRVVVQEGHNDGINFVKYSMNGQYLLSVGNDMKVWDVSTGKIIRSFYGFIDGKGQAEQFFGGNTVDFSPTGKYIIYVKPWDSAKEKLKTEVSIVSVETGKSIYDWWVIGEKNRIDCAVQFSPDGTLFAILASNEIYVYDFAEKKLLYTLSSKKLYKARYSKRLTFSGNGTYICANFVDSTNFQSCIVIWDVFQKKIVRQIYLDGSIYTNFAISHSGRYLVTGERDKTFVYDINTGKKIKTLDISPCLLQFTENEKQIVIFDEYYNHRIVVYDIYSGKQISSFNCERIESFTLRPGSEEFTFPEYYSDYIVVKKLDDFSTVRKYPDINFAIGGDFIMEGDGELFYEFEGKNIKSVYSQNFMGEKINFPEAANANIRISSSVIATDKCFFWQNNNLAYFDFHLKKTIVDTKIYHVFNYEKLKIWESLTASKDGKVICYGEESGRMTVYDVEKKNIRLSFFLSDYGIDKLNTKELSSTGKFIVLDTYYKHIIIDTISGILVHEEDCCTYGHDYTVGDEIKFSKNDKYAFFTTSVEARTKRGGFQDKYILYETETWKTINSNIILSKIGGDRLEFSPNEEFYAEYIGFTDGTYGIDLKTISKGTLISRIKINLPQTITNSICITNDNNNLLIRPNSSVTLRFSIATGKLLTSHIFDSSGDWFTYTPEGYFTGSPGGINKFVHLVDGMQVFELGQLYDTLYRPDLVQAKLEGKDIGENPLKKIVATGDAPRVQFTQAPMATARNVKVEFSVQDTGGGIGYVYLSQNGKAMQVSSGEKSKAGQRFIYTCDVTLAKGENVFEAYAANSANKIESRHVSSTLNWQGKVEDSNLYVLAIGVDKYIKMPQNNLKYSVADATGIIESFKASPGGLYGSVNVMTLLDSDVSKDNIQKAFETFASKVKPDDMFVLHLAGHGVNYGGEYYYLPSDTLAKSDSDYPKVGVSKHFLTESLSEIQSLNTIILLDTCYSGAFIDAKAQGNELAQKTALEHLAHTSGQVILTASANSQTAAEGYKGHGIFTYAIMEAISGKANYNADSTLSIKEITQYVGYEVPNIYEKMGLARQSPWNSPLRGDFSVVATGNRQSPQFHEVSLDGGKRTDWVTVRTDDSDVGNFENALVSAKKEAKKTSRSSGADQRSRGKGIYVGLGYGNTRFGSGFDISPEFYFLGWKHFYAGVGSDIIYKGAEKSESGKDIRKLDADIKFLLGYSYTFKRLRPYLCGGVGGYFSGDAKEKEIFVSSNSKTGVVTKTVYESDAKTGFVWEVAVGSDILLAEHFVIGAQYKLKNFVNCGFTDTWTVTIGWPF